jgi:hypothetical protein
MTLPFFAFVIFLAIKLLVQLFLWRSMVWVGSEECSSLDLTLPVAFVLVYGDQAAGSLEVIHDAIRLVARLTRIRELKSESEISAFVAASTTEFMLIVCRSGMLEGGARSSVSSHVSFGMAATVT